MYLFDQIISSCFYHFCCDFVCSWTLIHWHALHSFLHLFKKYIFIVIISWWRAYLFQLFYSLLGYADDTQLYISFSSSDSVSNLNTLFSTLDSVHAWLSSNRLSVNPS